MFTNIYVYFPEMDKKESKLMAYICDFSRQLDYLYKLITIISVQNLTQVGPHNHFQVAWYMLGLVFVSFRFLGRVCDCQKCISYCLSVFRGIAISVFKQCFKSNIFRCSLCCSTSSYSFTPQWSIGPHLVSPVGFFLFGPCLSHFLSTIQMHDLLIGHIVFS